jgi:HK97 family phage portal protein
MKLLGLNISRARERKEDPTWKSILAMMYGQEAVWTPTDYGKLAKAGYQLCAPAFACVSLIARSAAGISWTVGRQASDGELTELDNSPLSELLAHPNEYDHGFQFIEKVVSYKLLAGNSYILRVGIGTQPPRFLYALRPDRTKVKPGAKGGKELVGGYTYEANGITTQLKPEDVLHLRDFHPLDDFYGLSRLEVAARSIDISNSSAEWNAKILQNDMRPPGALVLTGNLTEDQRKFLERQLREKYMGSGNAGTPMILEGGFDWKQFAISPKDMDWVNADKSNLRRICSVFNVPSELLGDSENKTYSNVQEARKALYMETVLPIMDNLRDALNAWIVPLYGEGIVLDYDRDAIEALQEDRAAKYAYLAASDWLTVNEKREATGYDEVGPDGDVILVGIGKIPLEQSVAEPEPVPEALNPLASTGKPQDEEEPEPEGSGAGADEKAATGPLATPRAIPEHKATGFWGKPERKERLWLTFEARVKAREKSFEQMAKGYLRAQADALRQRASRLGSVSGVHAADIFSVKEEAKRYARTFTPWYVDHFIRAGNAGMRASKCELFDDGEFKSLAWKGDPKKPTSWVFTMTPAQDAKLKNMIFNSGTKVSETTLEIVERMIHEANDSNWTVAQLAQNLSDKATDLGPWRARLWARTESAKVDNYGAVEGFKETEFVELKGWMCSFVPDSRESHIAADGQEVLLEEDFNVAGERLEFPGDPRGSAGEVCNCLCGTYPVVVSIGEGGD